MTDYDEFEALKESIFAAYESQGFARDLIGGWAISENDVADFLALARTAAPKRILEVGTYVGVSTMMLASVCPDAEIFTVDPDFPLSIEMSAIGSGKNVSAESATHHAIARAAAERLGFSDRIHFFKGGFSVGDTFASSLGDRSAKTEIVGPALCAKHGPFDFVFIDGLHTDSAVLKDLELSVEHISAGAPMVLHDCIGFWGAGVRSGIFEFLRRRPEFAINHPKYADVYRSIGVVHERSAAQASTREPTIPNDELKSAATSIASTVFGDADVVEITVGGTYIAGASKKIALPHEFGGKGSIGDEIKRNDAQRVVAVEIADFADDALLAEIFHGVAAVNGAMFLGSTPPGEEGVAGPQSRPLSRLFDIASRCGLNLFLAPFIEHEHARYALLPEPRALGQSSLLLSFLVATKDASFHDAGGRDYVRLTEQLAREHEQAELQRIHLAAAYRRHYELAKNEHRIRFAAVAQLTRQIEEQTDAASKAKSEYEALIASANAEKIRIHDALSAQLAERDRETRELMATLVASYATIDSIERELTIQAQMLDGATTMPTATEFDEFSQDSTAALVMARKRSEYISQSLREVMGAATVRGPSIFGEAPATLKELSAEHARLHSELERIRRSLSWRLLGIYRVPRRFFARLFGG